MFKPKLTETLSERLELSEDIVTQHVGNNLMELCSDMEAHLLQLAARKKVGARDLPSPSISIVARQQDAQQTPGINLNPLAPPKASAELPHMSTEPLETISRSVSHHPVPNNVSS